MIITVVKPAHKIDQMRLNEDLKNPKVVFIS